MSQIVTPARRVEVGAGIGAGAGAVRRASARTGRVLRGSRAARSLRRTLTSSVASSLAVVTTVTAVGTGTAVAAPAVVAVPDHLTVTVREAGPGKDGTWELYCNPGTGTHPATTGACSRLRRAAAAGENPFAPASPGKGTDPLCTLQYGGPATARVTGVWGGRAVDARFDRGDGCRIGRWDALVPVLPAIKNAGRWS